MDRTFEPRQILIGHEMLWRALTAWARSRQLKLAQVRTPDDEVPICCFDVTSL